MISCRYEGESFRVTCLEQQGVKELSQSVCKTAKELTESCHSANNYRGAVRQRSLRMDQDIFNAKFFRPQKP